MFSTKSALLLAVIITVCAIQTTIDCLFSLSEMSELIRAKNILLRRIPMILRDDNTDRLPSESMPRPLARNQRQSAPEVSGETTELNIANTLLDTKSLMSLISLKQKIVTNVALLIRRLIDEIIFTLRLILRVFTTPLTASDNRTSGSSLSGVRQLF